MEKLWTKPTLELARTLLGMELIHDTDQGRCSGIIVETEAYIGPEDRAAHSFGGRRTPRTEIMYQEAGRIYMYLIYGMHTCFNLVSGPVGKPEAILVRALEPHTGIELMAERRGITKLPGGLYTIANGPGKLSKAMGFSLANYGDVINHCAISLKENKKKPALAIQAGPRININYAKEAAAYPWRFWIKNHPCVSKK